MVDHGAPGCDGVPLPHHHLGLHGVEHLRQLGVLLTDQLPVRVVPHPPPRYYLTYIQSNQRPCFHTFTKKIIKVDSVLGYLRCTSLYGVCFVFYFKIT